MRTAINKTSDEKLVKTIVESTTRLVTALKHAEARGLTIKVAENAPFSELVNNLNEVVNPLAGLRATRAYDLGPLFDGPGPGEAAEAD